MSYDFAVWTASWPDAETLRALVGADPALRVAEQQEGRLAVLRSTPRGDVPAFEVLGPSAVEPRDVPVEATALALGLRAVVAVVVPAASSGGVRAAAELCRRLAHAADGVVVDRTRDQVVWPPVSRRAYPRPDALAGDDEGTGGAPDAVPRVDVVQVDWHLRAADLPPDLAGLWLDLALRLLPEARPVGFGPTGPTGHTGPFTGRLDRDGEEAFRRAWAAGPRRLGWSARLPVLEGAVTGEGPVRTLSLTLLREAVHDPRWRHALLALLAAVADASGAFHAQAQVLRGWRWDARGASPGDEGERADALAPGGEWLGLPPEPVWCAWFGRPYDGLVRAALTAGETRPTGTGLLHLAAPEPVDRGQLVAAAPPVSGWQRLALRLGLRRRTWLPPDLSAVRQSVVGWSGPLRPARVRPPGLALGDEQAAPDAQDGAPADRHDTAGAPEPELSPAGPPPAGSATATPRHR